MQRAYVVTGVLTDHQTVTLDEALPLMPTKVRIVVEPLKAVTKRPHAEVLAEIRKRQAARGFKPSTVEEIDAYLRAERDSWDESE